MICSVILCQGEWEVEMYTTILYIEMSCSLA
jgi:hypothetical protein